LKTLPEPSTRRILELDHASHRMRICALGATLQSVATSKGKRITRAQWE
jgi:hypothetical protein